VTDYCIAGAVIVITYYKLKPIMLVDKNFFMFLQLNGIGSDFAKRMWSTMRRLLLPVSSWQPAKILDTEEAAAGVVGDVIGSAGSGASLHQAANAIRWYDSHCNFFARPLFNQAHRTFTTKTKIHSRESRLARMSRQKQQGMIVSAMLSGIMLRAHRELTQLAHRHYKYIRSIPPSELNPTVSKGHMEPLAALLICLELPVMSLTDLFKHQLYPTIDVDVRTVVTSKWNTFVRGKRSVLFATVRGTDKIVCLLPAPADNSMGSVTDQLDPLTTYVECSTELTAIIKLIHTHARQRVGGRNRDPSESLLPNLVGDYKKWMTYCSQLGASESTLALLQSVHTNVFMYQCRMMLLSRVYSDRGLDDAFHYAALLGIGFAKHDAGNHYTSYAQLSHHASGVAAMRAIGLMSNLPRPRTIRLKNR